jgi:multidrug efflux pump subunit AcrB
VPEVPQHDFFVQLELPQGTALARTESVVRALGAALDDDGAIELHFARVGSITAAGSAGGTVIGTHLGQIDVRLARDSETPSAAVEQRIVERMRTVLPIADVRRGRVAIGLLGWKANQPNQYARWPARRGSRCPPDARTSASSSIRQTSAVPSTLNSSGARPGRNTRPPRS